MHRYLLITLLSTEGTTPTAEQKQLMSAEKERLFDRQASQADVSRPFLHALAESRVQDIAVRTFLEYVARYCRSHYLVSPIEFPPDHPVEEVGRSVCLCGMFRKCLCNLFYLFDNVELLHKQSFIVCRVPSIPTYAYISYILIAIPIFLMFSFI